MAQALNLALCDVGGLATIDAFNTQFAGGRRGLECRRDSEFGDEIAALTKVGADLFGVEPRFSLRIEIKPKANAEREKVEEFNGPLGRFLGG